MKRQRSRTCRLVGSLALMAVTADISEASGAGPPDPGYESGVARSSAAVTAATPHPAVVRVSAAEQGAVSHGSGTLVDVRGNVGLVVTNWHVVRDARGPIEVDFPCGFRSAARVLKVDPLWDLAALVIWRPPVDPMPVAAAPPRPGETLAIAGYGPGIYRVACGQCTQYLAPGRNAPSEMVELGTAARQGDSGGPIVNSAGQLAGVLFGSGRGTTTGACSSRVLQFLTPLAPDVGSSQTEWIAREQVSPPMTAAQCSQRTASAAQTQSGNGSRSRTAPVDAVKTLLAALGGLSIASSLLRRLCS